MTMQSTTAIVVELTVLSSNQRVLLRLPAWDNEKTVAVHPDALPTSPDGVKRSTSPPVRVGDTFTVIADLSAKSAHELGLRDFQMGTKEIVLAPAQQLAPAEFEVHGLPNTHKPSCVCVLCDDERLKKDAALVTTPRSAGQKRLKAKRQRKRADTGDPKPLSIRFTWAQLKQTDKLCDELTKRAFGGQTVSRALVIREATARGLKQISKELGLARRTQAKWTHLIKEDTDGK